MSQFLKARTDEEQALIDEFGLTEADDVTHARGMLIDLARHTRGRISRVAAFAPVVVAGLVGIVAADDATASSQGWHFGEQLKVAETNGGEDLRFDLTRQPGLPGGPQKIIRFSSLAEARAGLLNVTSAGEPASVYCGGGTEIAIVDIVGDPVQPAGSGTAVGAGQPSGNALEIFVAVDDDQTVYTDGDGDGLVSELRGEGPSEAIMGTDPGNPDSDADGLQDGEEVHVYGTDPADWDSNDNGVSDGDDVAAGDDPRGADSDRDGLTDSLETSMGIDPLSADSDSGGSNDFVELRVDGTDPMLPGDDIPRPLGASGPDEGYTATIDGSASPTCEPMYEPRPFLDRTLVPPTESTVLHSTIVGARPGFLTQYDRTLLHPSITVSPGTTVPPGFVQVPLDFVSKEGVNTTIQCGGVLTGGGATNSIKNAETDQVVDEETGLGMTCFE